MTTPLIYLAGFDVFRQDAHAHGERLKALCAEHGFRGLYPLDNALPPNLPKRAAAQWIYDANVDLIRHADLVLANVNAFRGAEPDSGTAFEIGFAKALGKRIFAYTSQGASLLDQIRARDGDAQAVHDKEGYLIEDFDLPLNLMIACSSDVVVGTFEDALAQVKYRLARD